MTPLDTIAKICDVRPGGDDDTRHGMSPSYVAAPASVPETSDLMRVAAEHGLAVSVRGTGTRSRWGLPPRRCDLLIDTRRLDRILEHAAGDLVVKVEAGLTMDRLAEVLAGQRQRLALDTPLPGSTVGGTIATAACGPLRLRHGSPRDLLIGVTMIRADGQIAKAGGKVVKNVAGYDLGKLLSGSYGTLGVIVEAAFRLHPLPAARAFVTAAIPDGARAHKAVQAVLHSAVVPSAIELDAASSAESITLVVLLEGVAEGIAARTDQVVELLSAHAVSAHAVSATPPPWWSRYPAGQTLIELTAPPTFLTDLCRLTSRSAGVWLRGSAGSGHWQVGVSGELSATEVATLVETLRAELAPHGGAVVVRAAPDEVREKLDLWGPVPALELMRRVKDQFDPEHRLSPGSFIGGI